MSHMWTCLWIDHNWAGLDLWGGAVSGSVVRSANERPVPDVKTCTAHRFPMWAPSTSLGSQHYWQIWQLAGWQLDQKGFPYSYSRALVSRIVTGVTNVFVSFWACKSPPSVTDRARDASGVAILRRAIINLTVLKYLSWRSFRNKFKSSITGIVSI